jgi:hypothetical protein
MLTGSNRNPPPPTQTHTHTHTHAHTRNILHKGHSYFVTDVLNNTAIPIYLATFYLSLPRCLMAPLALYLPPTFGCAGYHLPLTMRPYLFRAKTYSCHLLCITCLQYYWPSFLLPRSIHHPQQSLCNHSPTCHLVFFFDEDKTRRISRNVRTLPLSNAS